MPRKHHREGEEHKLPALIQKLLEINPEAVGPLTRLTEGLTSPKVRTRANRLMQTIRLLEHAAELGNSIFQKETR